MIIFTARDPRDPGAPVPRRRVDGAGALAHHPLHHAAGDPLADQLRDDLPDALAAGQLRVHLAASPRAARSTTPPSTRSTSTGAPSRTASTPTARRWRSCLIVIGVAVALLGWRFFDMQRAAAAAADRGALMAAVARRSAARRAGADWDALAARARTRRRATTALLYAFLIVGSLPIILPYLWLVTVAFSGRTGASTPSCSGARCAVVVPALLGSGSRAARRHRRPGAARRRLEIAARRRPSSLLAVLIGPDLHLDNCRFLWSPTSLDRAQGRRRGVGAHSSRASGQPSATRCCSPARRRRSSSPSPSLAGYYLSRFEFPGRAAMLPQGLLVLHAFPAMTLIIPIFLMIYWIGLLDTLTGVILVLVALRAALRDLRHEGLLRRRALGHRDERA